MTFRKPLSDAYVEAVHRGFGAVLDQELDRVGGFGDGVFHDRVHAREHVVRDRDSCGRASDPDAHPDEVIAQSPYDGTQAVVPAPPPTLTRTVPASRSRSSWTTMRFSGLWSETAEPVLFINVVGLRRVAF